MAFSVTVIRRRQGSPQVEVDQGRVISSAISMTFTLIANISSVKVRGHVISHSRVAGAAGRAVWAGWGGLGGRGWYLIAPGAGAVSIC